MSYKEKNIYQDILTEADGNTFEDTVMEEEPVVNQSINIIKKESNVDTAYEENANEDEKAVSPAKNSESIFVGVKQEWAAAETQIADKSMGSVDSEDERAEFCIEKTEEEQEAEDDDDEEETIAMFVTASGQQLALYAVEDSDDYFAVAVYDESGEPPSNFQFLMKSDVERLIREGAVRTVKKPTQIKRQLVTTQPPVFVPKVEITEDTIKSENHAEPIKNRNLDNKKTVKNYVKSEFENLPKPKIVRLDDSGSDEELVEQSTVQYILCDGDQSDTELTFDEIQATLQGLKTNDIKKTYKNIAIDKPSSQKRTNNGLVYIGTPPPPPPSQLSNASYRAAFYPNSMKMESSPTKPASPMKRSHLSNTSIIGSKQNHGTKRELSPMADYYTPNTSFNISLSDSLTNTNSQSKVKRPRKQQLTSVNREDTEIIIQPASMLEEEEEIPMPRKRGKRKKKNAKMQKIPKLPTRKSTRRRRTRVEIIDLDLDDSDSDEPPRRKEILEITLDENKEKGSSDKENEIIMVGDSDEDEEDDDEFDDNDDDDDDNDDEEDVDDESDSMKCKHCSKTFKQRRAFDSHSRVCAKFRGRSQRYSDRLGRDDETSSDEESPREKRMSKNKHSKDKSSKPKKEYTCKTCEEKFDMVVTLARHVRAEHTPRKRGRPSKADQQKLQMQIELNRRKNLERKKAEGKSKDESDKDDGESNEEETISSRHADSERDQETDEETKEKEEEKLGKKGRNEKEDGKKIERKEDKIVEKQVDREVEKQVDREVEKQIDSEVGKQIDSEVENQVDREVEKQIDSEVEKQVDREVEKQVDSEVEKQDDREAEKVDERKTSKKDEKKEDGEKEEEEEEQEENPRNELPEENLKPNTTTPTNAVSQAKLAKLANRRKLIARLHRKWKFADLSCTICNRWLPSASAHENHILQHFTKRRIARDIYECPICHKFFNSQYVYMKHKQMHTKVERNFKSEESEMEKYEASRISTLRRYERPRNLK